MDFELSDDQRALQDAARDLLDGRSSPQQVRAHMASHETFDAKLWSAMIDQGWMGVTLPEADGGLGMGWVEAAVLMEEVGRHTAPAPFTPSLLALGGLHAAHDVDVARTWRDRIAGGEAVGCVAWSAERDAVAGLAAGSSAPRSPAAAAPAPTSHDVGATTALTGRLGPVVAAPAADVCVVALPDAVVLIDLAATGRPAPQPAMDETRALGWLDLDATPATVIGDAEAADRLLDAAAVAMSAEMLGGAGRVLEMTADYAKERVQFGQPIGSFQAVKHRCADMVVDVEGMRSTAWYAAWSLGQTDNPEEASVAASTSKIWCSDASKRVMGSGLQVHGGIGFTWEHDLHLYLKRAQLDQLSFGSASFHRQRLAARLRRRVDAGRSVI